MKRTLIIFGVFDFISLLRNYQHIIDLIVGTWTNFDWIAVCNILLYPILFVSGYFLIKQRKMGVWLTYAQFPLRVLFQTLSFGFLWMVIPESAEVEILFSMILVFLEIMRLTFTIYIHRTRF